MKFSSIIRKNFTHNFNKYISFYFVNSLIIAMLFMYGSLMFNKSILDTIGETAFYETINISLMGLIVFSIVFITYTNISFLKNRGKEFGMYLTLGMTTKDLSKLIIVENLGVMIASLVTGIITGALFGRLFYMGLNKVLKFTNIAYDLNFKSFLLSAGIFILIFLCNVIFNIIYIKRVSIIDAIKADKKKEVGKANILVGIITSILFVVAMYCLPKTMFKEIFDGSTFVIGLCVAAIILCPYIILASGIAVFKYIIAKFPRVYNKNILVVSNLSHRFLAYKNLLYMLSILLAGSMFYVGYSYSIYTASKENIQEEKAVPFINYRYTSAGSTGNAIVLDDSDYDAVKSMINENNSKKAHLITMIFIGILFMIANGVVLYYKVLSDIDSERERIISLNRIGITTKEIQKIINKELSITFFVPLLFGGGIGMYFLYIMVSNSGMTQLLMKKSLLIFIGGVIIQSIFYLVSRRKYTKEILFKNSI